MEAQEIINEVNIRPKNIEKKKIDEASLSICKIEIDNESGTGFFLNLKDKLGKNYLITNYHVISKEYVDQKKTIKIKLDNNGGADIKLDGSQREIKFFQDLFDHDIIIIQILESDNLDNKVKFLNYNPKFIHGYRQYIGKDIFITGYPLGGSLQFNQGKITNLKGTFEFEHNLDTDNGSSGSPIFLYDNTLVGLHRGRYKGRDEKVGIFIGEIIILLIKELDSIINRNISNYNESNLHDKIDESSSNVQDFYQLYYNENIEIKHLFNLLRKTLEDFKYLFILVLGENKIANLNILNGLIEFEILPRECQNKNIIIKHCKDDNIILRKIKFKSENSLDFNGDTIGIGFDEIQNILIKDQKNIKDKEEFIYGLYINNKFIEKNIKGELKEKLCFINLPNPSLIPNISKYLIENSEISLYVVDYANNLYNNLKFIEKYYIDIYKDSFQREKEIIQKKIIKNSLILINYKKEQEISQEAFKKIEIDLKKFTGELTKEKEAKLEYRILNIDYYEKKMTKYFEELETFIQNEYTRYRLSKENNLENKKITFDEYILKELNNYLTNYGSGESSDSKSIKGDIIGDSLRNNLENVYEIQNKELDSIIKKFISMNQYFSKEQDFQNKINLFVDKFKIIVLESNLEVDKVFKQKIQNCNQEIDNNIDANEKETKTKKLEELENIFKNLESKHNQITRYIEGDINSVINILENEKNKISNYNLAGRDNYEYFKKKIKNDLRERLNNLVNSLNAKIYELSDQSSEYYKNFYELLCRIEELKNDNDFLTFSQFLDKYAYRNLMGGIKTNEIEYISKNIDEETKNANSIKYISEVNGFLSYLYAKIDSNQYSENIEKYLKKICSEKIDNVINSFKIDNNKYCQNIKNKIDNLLRKAKSIIEEKQKFINEEIERDKTKREKWERMKINLTSF